MKLPKKQPQVAVLDIGSGKLSVMVGKKTEDSFIVIAQSESRYGGFIDDQWLEADNLFECVSKTIKRAQRSYGKKIREIYVGVPGSFTSVAACEASVSFRYKKKFDKFDLLEIFNKANIYKDNIGFRAINRSPIYYLLNDEIKTMDPIGKVGTKLTGLISYTYADVNYLNKMAKILKEIGITKTEFVSNCLAESWFLFDAKMRDNYIILIDVGYICTNIMLIYGDGIVFLKSFAIGSGHISADLCEMLNMDYKSAEELISKINLNLEFDIEDTYKLSKGLSVNAEKANNIVKARIEDIADYLNRCMQLCPYVIDSNTPVYLTGGGLTYIKGGAQCLSVMLDKTVKTAISNNPLTNNPQHSTAYGLMDIAFKQKNN